MTHLDSNKLLDGLEGRLKEDELAAFQAHMAECDECAQEFRQLCVFFDALSGPGLIDAPRAAIERATAIFQHAERTTPSVLSVLATMVFDSWGQVAVAGLRGSWDTRQLAMTAAEFDLHLGIDYATAMIHGQLLSRENPEFVHQYAARLCAVDDKLLDMAKASEFGEFVFANIPQEADAIVIQLDDGRAMKFPLPANQPQRDDK